jgi:hypothetical protein
MNNELERIWKEAVMDGLIKVLSQHLLGGTEVKHKKPQSGQPVSWPRCEPRTS